MNPYARRPLRLTSDDHAAWARYDMDGSTPSFHRPIAEAWRKAHIAEAVPPNRPRP